MLFVPTFIELTRLKKMGVLNKLRGEARDVDAPIRDRDGKEKARPKPPKCKYLHKELTWLQSYRRTFSLSLPLVPFPP